MSELAIKSRHSRRPTVGLGRDRDIDDEGHRVRGDIDLGGDVAAPRQLDDDAIQTDRHLHGAPRKPAGDHGVAPVDHREREFAATRRPDDDVVQDSRFVVATAANHRLRRGTQVDGRGKRTRATGGHVLLFAELAGPFGNECFQGGTELGQADRSAVGSDRRVALQQVRERGREQGRLRFRIGHA